MMLYFNNVQADGQVEKDGYGRIIDTKLEEWSRQSSNERETWPENDITVQVKGHEITSN